MKRLIVAVVALAATAAFAQQAAPAAKSAPASKPVAIVNGEVITQEKLDTLYGALSPQMRTQYDANGGKGAFLDNYIRKRLILQEAMKSGYDQRPDVRIITDAAKESSMFDRYVRDIVASHIVTESDIQQYYDQHRSDFAIPEQLKLYHIVLTTSGAQAMSKQEAAQKINEIAAKLREDAAKAAAQDPASAPRILLSFFKNAARQYSMDASAQKGGDLGWVQRGSLDQAFEAAAVATPVGGMSPVVESAYGYHLIYNEGTKPAGFATIDQVRAEIREKLLSDKTPLIMQEVSRLTNELRAQGKISVLPENID